MKTSFFPASLFSVLVFFSCADIDVSDMGSQLLTSGDKILVDSATFPLQSGNFVVPYIYAYPDSFLLGTFYDEQYGTTHADIFAQVEQPAKYPYPRDLAISPDSIYLIMHYQKYFGDKYSPMHISIYEMNKAGFNYTTAYPSNLKPEDYTDKSLLLGKKTITAVDAAGKNDSNAIVIKLSDEFLTRFSKATPEIFEDDAKFQEFFRGLYITTDFGSATMLYIKQIDMEYFHHYTYSVKGSTGQDSTVVVNNSFTFPANESVRQVNRFLNPDSASVIARLNASSKQIHQLASPAKLFTSIKVPLRKMHQRMEAENKRLYINNAKLRIEVTDINAGNFTIPLSASLLMVREKSMNRFFARKELPSDTVAVLGNYSYAYNTSKNEYEYFYEFDLSTMLATEFEKAGHQSAQLPEFSDFVIVPVRVSYNSNNYITKVKHQILMNAVTICGGNHPDKPMKIRTIFSRF